MAHEHAKLVAQKSVEVWAKLCRIHAKLATYPIPKITFNNRIYITAGTCDQSTRTIELGNKFFSAGFGEKMLNVILPHELIHQADFDLFGDSDKACGHGANWRMLMMQYGLPADPYHSMFLNRKGEKVLQ